MDPIAIQSPTYPAAPAIAMPGNDNPNPLPSTAQNRGTRAAVGLSALTGQNQPEIATQIAQGGEDQFRAAASAMIDKYNQQQRTQAIQNTAVQGLPIHPDLLKTPEPSDPSTVIEKSFANAFTADLFKRDDPDGVLADAYKLLPQHAEDLHHFTKESISKRQYTLTRLENVEDVLKNQSYFSWGINQILEMFQPYNELRLRGNTEGANMFALRMLGTDLKEQADIINSDWIFDGFRTKLDTALDKLKGNPDLQHKLLSYILNTESSNWDNFWTASMFAGGAASIAKRGLALVKTSADAVRAAKDGEELSKHVGIDKELTGNPAFWEHTGDTSMSPEVARPLTVADDGEAAVQQAVKEDEAKLTGKFNPTQQAVDAIQKGFKKTSNRLGTGTGGFSRDVLIRIKEQLETLGTDLSGLLERQVRVNLSSELTANPAAKRSALDLVRKQNPELDAHVNDLEEIIHEPITNTFYGKMILGKSDGTRWTGPDGEAAARSWADHAKVELAKEEFEPLEVTKIGDMTFRRFPSPGKRQKIVTPGATVESQNGGWYVSKYIPIDLNSEFLHQFIGSTKEAEAPWGPIKAFFDWVSTPEASMSKDQRAKRLIATEGPSKFYKLMSDYTSTIPKLSRKEATALKRIIAAGQNIPNRELNKMGYFFKDIHEFADSYLRLEGEMPSARTVQAYFEFRGAMEADYWLREVAVHRNALQNGNQEWRFISRDDTGEHIRSPWVTGKSMQAQDFPNSPDAIVALIPSSGGLRHASVKRGNTFGQLDNIKQDIANGKAKLIKIWDTSLNELAGHFGVGEDDRVQYVLAYNTRDRGLSWGKLGRTEGGHLEREYNGYISQAHVTRNNIIKKWIYHRDNNLFGVMNGAEGKKAAKVLDQMREFKLANNEEGARAFWKDNVTSGLSFHDVWDAFNATRNADGKLIPPRLSLNEPIQWRPKDKTLMDLGESVLRKRYEGRDEGFVDGTKTGNPARSQSIQYTGERDSFDFHGVRDVGTKYNPIFKVQQDPYIDGLSMMNRGLGRIINSLYMDDYKFSAVRNWLFGSNVPSAADPTKLVGAAEWLVRGEKDTDDALRHSPYYYFYHGRIKDGTPGNIRAALEADKMKIRSFIGIPSKFDTYLHSLEQHVADSIYTRFGPKGLKAYELTPLWKISTLSDGPRFLRSVLYNTKMGFFSPRQFFIHFFTFINAALIAPQYAGHGMMGATFHLWASLNRHPEILNHLDEKASKIGWRPGEWREAFETGQRTNFFHVESGQIALLDDPTKTSLVSNKWSQFLDLGMTPFKKGVQSLKTASWYTAYKEFRDLHPTGPLARNDIESILLRANDLSHNMSRASTSSIQKGMMTFGAQFSSYNLRLLELLIGKRLNGAEKARLLFGYMGIFGVPTAAGIFGASSLVRGQVDKGNVPGLTSYVPGYDFTTTAIMEGLVPAVVNELTGHVPNLGESYGAKDLEVIERTLDSDSTLWQFYGGAAYSTLSNTWANSSPFRLAMMQMLKGEAPYNLTVQDYVHFLSEISSVNYAWRTYMALETGKYMSRNGAYLEPSSPEWGIFSGITGLANQAVSDIYRTTQDIKERRAMEAKTFGEYAQVMQRYFQAMADNNPEQAEKYGKNAAILLQAMPMEARGRAIARIAAEHGSLIDRIQWSYSQGDRNIPDADRERLQRVYQKQQEIKNR